MCVVYNSVWWGGGGVCIHVESETLVKKMLTNYRRTVFRRLQ